MTTIIIYVNNSGYFWLLEKIVRHIIPFHLPVFNNRASPIAEGAATY
jgi:hypothetical protein